jgi:isopenicillin-N epimerase
VLLDHITSGTGLVLPIKRFAALCKSKNVPILVDGAHAIGQVPVDIKDINANFYVSNIHKWAFGAKGNAFLYIGRQHTGSVHPPVFGEGSGFGQLAEFSWAGTRDYTPYLTTFAALEFFKRAGGGLLSFRFRWLFHDVRILPNSTRCEP